jgi:hypothetical protein
VRLSTYRGGPCTIANAFGADDALSEWPISGDNVEGAARRPFLHQDPLPTKPFRLGTRETPKGAERFCGKAEPRIGAATDAVAPGPRLTEAVGATLLVWLSSVFACAAARRSSRAMSDRLEFRRKEDILAILRRACVPDERLKAVGAVLPDPVDVTDAENLLLRYGITLDSLISRMGGSP